MNDYESELSGWKKSLHFRKQPKKKELPQSPTPLLFWTHDFFLQSKIHTYVVQKSSKLTSWGKGWNPMIYKVLYTYIYMYIYIYIQKVVGLGIFWTINSMLPHFFMPVVVAGAEVRMIWGEELEDGCFLA